MSPSPREKKSNGGSSSSSNSPRLFAEPLHPRRSRESPRRCAVITRDSPVSRALRAHSCFRCVERCARLDTCATWWGERRRDVVVCRCVDKYGGSRRLVVFFFLGRGGGGGKRGIYGGSAPGYLLAVIGRRADVVIGRCFLSGRGVR